MCQLPSATGSDSHGEISGETGYSSEAPSGKTHRQELAQKANSVPITLLFKHFNVSISAYTRKTACPFKSHKGGRERTPSFWHYPETNTYCCFGCRNGSFPVDFVSIMEGITKPQAAIWILERFGEDVVDGTSFEGPNFAQRMDIMMDFSNTVRDFRQSHTDPQSIDFIEKICAIYDDLNFKHELRNNAALHQIVEQLKEKIEMRCRL